MAHSSVAVPVRAGRPLLAIGVIAAIFMLGAAPAFAADPPGNNGTIKVDGIPLDPGPGDDGPGDPDNEPHVGCQFAIDWYGFDAGDLYSEALFQVWPSTGERAELEPVVVASRAPEDGHDAFGGDGRVYIGEDSQDGAGSADGLDASVTYDLSEALAAFTPHPEQGYHVKLTTDSDGSQGARMKHKVFWIAPCAEEEEEGGQTGGGAEGGQTGGDLAGGGDVRGSRSGTAGGAMLPNTAVPTETPASVLVTAGVLIVGSTVAATALQVTRRRT